MGLGLIWAGRTWLFFVGIELQLFPIMGLMCYTLKKRNYLGSEQITPKKGRAHPFFPLRGRCGNSPAIEEIAKVPRMGYGSTPALAGGAREKRCLARVPTHGAGNDT